MYSFIHSYMCIYADSMETGRTPRARCAHPTSRRALRKGTNGVNTNGVTAIFMFFDRGTFWVPPLTYFYIPKIARAYFFPNLSKFITFAAAPLVLTRHASPPGLRRRGAGGGYTYIYIYIYINNMYIYIYICNYNYITVYVTAYM